MGLGALSLWPLGLRPWRLGLGAGSPRGAAGLRPRARGLSWRPRGPQPSPLLGGAGLGGAGAPVGGAVPRGLAGRPPSPPARTGRPGVRGLAPIRGPLAVQPVAASLVPGAG